MISRVEVLNYRCLRYVSQPLDRFRVLVGPNASGKSTFLDALSLVRDVLTPEIGVEGAVGSRCTDFRQLLWRGEGNELQIAVELRPDLSRVEWASTVEWASDLLFRYELAIGATNGRPQINAEALYLYPDGMRRGNAEPQRSLFPAPTAAPPSVLDADSRAKARGRMKLVAKARASGKDYFQWRPPKEHAGRSVWNQVTAIGRSRAALGFLPATDDSGEDHFLGARWVQEVLTRQLQRVQLDPVEMARPCPPLRRGGFAPDGSNLPWVVKDMRENHRRRHELWIEHLQTVLPDVQDVDAVVRPEDQHCYLVVRYAWGWRVPSWGLSDGTRRIVALTLLAYYPGLDGVYMIEEPENGIHPRGMGGIVEGLGSMWHDQVLLATHSPALLALIEPNQVLCFGSDADGVTDVVLGEQHPRLREWQGTVNMALLNASGVLG